MRILPVLLIVLVISSWANRVLAGDYHVEIIVFKNMTEYPSHDNRNYTPPTPPPGFAAHWEASEYKLEDKLKQIEESENYEVLLHHAWQQESLPYSESAAVELVLDPKIHNQYAHSLQKEMLETKKQPIAKPSPNNIQQSEIDDVSTKDIENKPVVNQAINGWIKIYAKTLLFAEFDIDYFGYRLQEKRRLLLDEVHFLDHPKFGVLLQISRIEETEEENANTAETEPQPVTN